MGVKNKKKQKQNTVRGNNSGHHEGKGWTTAASSESQGLHQLGPAAAGLLSCHLASL